MEAALDLFDNLNCFLNKMWRSQQGKRIATEIVSAETIETEHFSSTEQLKGTHFIKASHKKSI